MTTGASIALRDVTVEFPVYNAATRSIKDRVLKAATGGVVHRHADGIVVVRSLDGITLDFRPGDRVGLIGHNGAGKTTLLRVLSGIYHPTAGHVDITGEVTSLINIGLGIDPEFTGRENIRLRAALMGLSSDELNARSEEIIEFSGLREFIDMPFRTYSAGMQLRLAFSVSTCIHPEILVMDEWLSTGDLDFRERAERRLHRVVSATQILVIASHSTHLLESNCNRLVWLERGRVRADGPVDRLLPAYLDGAGGAG